MLVNLAVMCSRKVSTLTGGSRYQQPALRSATNNPASLLNAPQITVNDVHLVSACHVNKCPIYLVYFTHA